MSEADLLALGIRIAAFAVWATYFLTKTPTHSLTLRIKAGLVVTVLFCLILGGLVPLGIFPIAASRAIFSGYAIAALVVGVALWFEDRG